MYSLIKFLRIEWWDHMFNRSIKAGETEAIERLKILMKTVYLRKKQRIYNSMDVRY